MSHNCPKSNGWMCELPDGHDGPHGFVTPGSYGLSYDNWDDDGNPIEWAVGQPNQCMHKSLQGKYHSFCCRAKGHDGPHMLSPQFFDHPNSQWTTWGEDGQPLAENQPEEEPEVQAPGPEIGIDVEFAADYDTAPECSHRGPGGWFCQRPKGHDGWHAINRQDLRHEQVTYDAWDDDGNPVDIRTGIPVAVLSVSTAAGDWYWKDEADACNHCGPDGYCERTKGHTGPHMMPEFYESPPWGDDGKRVEKPAENDGERFAALGDDGWDQLSAEEINDKFEAEGWEWGEAGGTQALQNMIEGEVQPKLRQIGDIVEADGKKFEIVDIRRPTHMEQYMLGENVTYLAGNPGPGGYTYDAEIIKEVAEAPEPEAQIGDIHTDRYGKKWRVIDIRVPLQGDRYVTVVNIIAPAQADHRQDRDNERLIVEKYEPENPF